MKRCDRLVDVGRRQFLRGAGVATAGAAAATVVATETASAAPANAQIDYPSNKLANVKDLKVNVPVEIEYPDKDVNAGAKFGQCTGVKVGQWH